MDTSEESLNTDSLSATSPNNDTIINASKFTEFLTLFEPTDAILSGCLVFRTFREIGFG